VPELPTPLPEPVEDQKCPDGQAIHQCQCKKPNRVGRRGIEQDRDWLEAKYDCTESDRKAPAEAPPGRLRPLGHGQALEHREIRSGATASHERLGHGQVPRRTDHLSRRLSSPRSEETVPGTARWYWDERVERYVTSRNGVGES
jgi:hypothetical protein